MGEVTFCRGKALMTQFGVKMPLTTHLFGVKLALLTHPKNMTLGACHVYVL